MRVSLCFILGMMIGHAFFISFDASFLDHQPEASRLCMHVGDFFADTLVSPPAPNKGLVQKVATPKFL